MSMETNFAGEEFSPGELAYMQSGGTNADAIKGDLEAFLGRDGQGEDQAADQVDQEKPDLGQPGQGVDQVDRDKPLEPQDSAQSGTKSGQGENEDKKPSHVPLPLLEKERQRRYELERQLAQVQERFSRADERQRLLNELLGVNGKLTPQQEETIDPEKDIFGAFKQLQTRFNELQGKHQEVNNRVTQQTEDQKLKSAYFDDVNRSSTTGDFMSAYNHLMQTRNSELESLGISDVQQRKEIMLQEEAAVVRQAFSGGRSPSEVLYGLAKLRGFQGKPAAEPESNAAQVQAQQDKAQASHLAGQLGAVEKARAASVSLSGAGASGGSGLTAQQLADMSEDDFADTYSKLKPSELRKLMGG